MIKMNLYNLIINNYKLYSNSLTRDQQLFTLVCSETDQNLQQESNPRIPGRQARTNPVIGLSLSDVICFEISRHFCRIQRKFHIITVTTMIFKGIASFSFWQKFEALFGIRINKAFHSLRNLSELHRYLFQDFL